MDTPPKASTSNAPAPLSGRERHTYARYQIPQFPAAHLVLLGSETLDESRLVFVDDRRVGGCRPQQGDCRGRQPPISNCGHAAIDRKVRACDEACFVRRKEQGGRRDLLWAAEPPERARRGELDAGLVGPFLGRRLLVEDRRVDRTWADRIDADAAVLQLGRPGADEGADCRLGGAVGGEAGDTLVV